MPVNSIPYYYHKAGWTNAFSGNSSKILFSDDGSVYKDTLEAKNLVVSGAGELGNAGTVASGRLSLYVNRNGLYSGQVSMSFDTTGTGADNISIGSGDTAITNQWVHGAVSVDNLNKEAKVYVDGVLKSTVAFVGEGILFSSLRNSVIGKSVLFNSGDFKFKGKIDDFRIYREVLTAQDIDDIRQFGNQRLQFDEKIYVPTRGNTKGKALSLKLQSDDFMQIRSIALEYFNQELR